MDPKSALHRLRNDPRISDLLSCWTALQPNVVATAIDIQSIPAPTFEEFARSARVESEFVTMGLQDVEQDHIGNVYGRIPGTQPELPGVMVSAHLDTVFDQNTPLDTSTDADLGRVYGPGLGDNSMGLAAMLALAEQLVTRELASKGDIWWVATVGEEGLGDLRGMRQALTHLKGRIGAAIILEGMGLGQVYHSGLGVRRLRVSVKGPGGHSWLHSGERSSAIHHLIGIASGILQRVDLPFEQRSSLNIGLIQGGTSINTIAAAAGFELDLRSVDAAALAELEAKVRQQIEQVTGTDETLETIITLI
ncbi:MAG: M20/M25/M40 family metallo-hydrolase, partial [Chloroflexi bacterium]|nr:M20/M25/M40 family metallo-hydrolase [Chloroflexota bacterium]